MTKLDYNPMESKVLNEAFKSQEVKNIDEKYESLINWWIHPEFAMQLDKMFEGISASTIEIMEQKDKIVAANNRIEDQSQLSRSTKTNLAIMKSA